MSKEIQFTGKTAIIVAVIVIAFGLFNYSKTVILFLRYFALKQSNQNLHSAVFSFLL